MSDRLATRSVTCLWTALMGMLVLAMALAGSAGCNWG